MKFALIALVAATSAIQINNAYPGAYTGAHNCENGDGQRTFEAGQKGFISNSAQGASCTNNIGDAVDVQLNEEPAPANATAPAAAPAAAAPADAKKLAEPAAKPAEKKEDFSALKGLEHCPDFNERFTLVNGRTRAIAYPNAGFNCSEQYGLV